MSMGWGIRGKSACNLACTSRRVTFKNNITSDENAELLDSLATAMGAEVDVFQVELKRPYP